MTKDQLEKALEAVDQKYEEPCGHTSIYKDETEAVRFAIRVALKVMGEPSQEMVLSAVEAWNNSKFSVVTQYKAMINQAIVEVAK